jgi:hypothetical protein
MKHLLLTLLLITASKAVAITLSWNASSDPLTVGYNLYVGSAPGKETLYKKLGNVLTFTFAPQQPTGTWFGYVTSYNAGGSQSLISNEVCWVTNTPTPTPAPGITLKCSTIDPVTPGETP